MDEPSVWDFIVVGSGFGGSVSALRLAETGARVLVLEKGRRFRAEDFPTSNWRLRRWLWRPRLGLRGPFRMTFLRHLTALSGVGVGGGSLVYANTLPLPGDEFFRAPSWGHLADWSRELEPHYATARRMLGAARYTRETWPDEVLREVATDMGIVDRLRPVDVGVWLGEPGKTVPDPYFDGEGPERTGCIHCGGCMLGCRHGAKNTLDRNYLWLAERRGAVVRAESEVAWIRTDREGYRLEVLEGIPSPFRRRARRTLRARRVVLAGGVLGTVPLLLRLRSSPDGLPALSPRTGDFVRTNSEVLMGVVSARRDRVMSEGVAITSALRTDEHSYLQPVRYPEGSGFFRLLSAPHAPGATLPVRLRSAAARVLRHPGQTLRAFTVRDHSRHTMILLYMRALEGHLSLRRTPAGRLTTRVAAGPTPTAAVPEASELAERIAAKVDGYPMSLLTEGIMGTPTTAHILGGAVMGANPEEGVIDRDHRAWGYPGLYVVDGAAVSANPGVNPALTITAMAERAMARLRESG